MANIKPFRGIRPPKDLVEKVACLPYDVMSSEEARVMAEGKPMSLLHITKAEIDFAPGYDEHSDEVYQKSLSNFKMFQEEGYLKRKRKICIISMLRLWTVERNTELLVAHLHKII